MSGHLPAFFGMEARQVRVASSNVESQRACAIGDWLATGRSALKHVLLRLEQDGNGDVRASAQAFVGRF